MKEQFDKRFVEKIKDSFLNHEEPFEPMEWDKFSQAYFNKPTQKRRWVYWPFWVSGVAASLLLFLFFWPLGDKLEENVQTLTDSIIIKSKPFHGIEPLSRPKVLKQDPSEFTEPQPPKIGEEIESTPLKIAREDQMEIVINRDNMARIFNKHLVSKIEPPLGSDQLTIAQGHESQKGFDQTDGVSPKESMNMENAKAMVDQWKNGDPGNAKANDVETRKTSKALRLGLVLGPQAASNPESGMNFGGGVMSELSLSNRFKIDFGVTYAQQKLEPDNFETLPASMTLRAENDSYTNDYVGSEYTLNYASLDIPINLKYKVMDKANSNLFLITGLSSMVYLDQSTVETYSVQSNFIQSTSANGALLFEPSVQEYKTKYSPESGQNKMDLGRMLNLSFGYEYQLNDGTFISLEPYYKVPLGDLTFANQQFSIGGMNLRVNFQFKK